MKSKRIAGWVAVLGIAAGITACGTQNQTGSDTKSSSNQDVTLQFWNGFTGPDRPAVQKIVDAFNASHPHIKVQMDIEPWDTLLQKLPTTLTSGQGPDLVAFDTSLIPEYAQANLIVPLDKLYTSGQLTQQTFPKSLMDAMQYNGHTYAAPANFYTLLLYYNKKIFQQDGLDPNKPPTNWDEWIRDIQKTTHKSPNGQTQYGLSLADNNTVPMWPVLVWGNGGSFVSADLKHATMDSPKTVSAIQKWATLIHDNDISPAFQSGAQADKLFQTGQAAMEIGGPWMTTGLTQAGLDYGVAPIPAGPSGPATLAAADALVVTKNSKYSEQAMEFIRYWDSQASQEKYSLATGFPPVRTDMANDPAFKSNPFIKSFAAVSDSGRFFLQGITNAQDLLNNVIYPAIQSVEKNPQNADSILRAANQELQSKLDQ
jgi:multiple sugar transport system substrate-binding protein